MPTPSSTGIAQPEPDRDPRDRPFVRVAILVTVLLLAGLAARSCGGGASDALSQSEAVEAARSVAVVKSAKAQVRYLNQGVPPRGTWLVSFYTGPVTDPVTVQNIVVDAKSGAIVDDGR